jgi:hypothetical protein
MSINIKKLLREGLIVDSQLTEIERELDFSSFKVKDTLNPEVWVDDNTVNPKIRELLIKIAKDYYKSLELNLPISDIAFTGSLANYNWSRYSDCDVHI